MLIDEIKLKLKLNHKDQDQIQDQFKVQNEHNYMSKDKNTNQNSLMPKQIVAFMESQSENVTANVINMFRLMEII